MTSLLGAGATILGLAAIAGILYLLQRLRVRHRPVRVVSTLFWREAVEEARARVLVQRFRHPLIYLFLLGILALLWLATSGLDVDRRFGAQHLVLIDGSARMGSAGSFERALALAEETVAELPRERRTVILCAGEARTLLAPGEATRLLEERSVGLTPAAAPTSIDRTLAAHLETLSTAPSATVWVVGETPISARLRASLPQGVSIVPLVTDVEGAVANVGITACGVSAAESGVWERVDLLLEVRSRRSLSADTVAITATLDGQSVLDRGERVVEGNRAEWNFRDLPANGGLFEVAVIGTDGNPLDDRAARVLPVRQPISVLLSPSLAPWLEPVLRSDRAVQLVTEGARVVVRREGELLGGDIPALEFVSPDDQEESILLTHRDDVPSAEVLERALIALGLDQVDAMELAESSGRPITLGARPGSRRSIGVWSDLLAEDYNFVTSRSFPLFIALSLRWILEVEEFPAEVAAGQRRSVLGPWTTSIDGSVSRYDSVGAPLRPPFAGEYTDAGQREVAVSLLDPPGIEESATVASEATVLPSGARSSLGRLLAALALVLLLVEGFWHRRGEVP